jgi:prevent-host-death family protein
MKTIRRIGAEEARRRLPALIEEAAAGQRTIITKHGKPYAALVPASSLERTDASSDLRSLRGSGKRLWGRSVRRTLRAMRDEWQ